MLHLPLQATIDDLDAEPLAIRLDMTRQEFQVVFAAALSSVPHAVGVNNHRGSLLTRHPGHMLWLMEEIRARDDLFFLDSFTTHASVALRIAEEAGVVAIVYTDISRDGMMKGVNVEATVALAQSINIPVIASGGVTNMDDIKELCTVEDKGITGTILGRSIYEGTIDLAEAHQYVESLNLNEKTN